MFQGGNATHLARLTFHGAARTVTGSKYRVEAGGDAVLVDCGLFQGEKTLRLLNWAEPSFDPRKIRALILTHAHLDHIGYLPRAVRAGFRGKVYATPATCELGRIMLADSAQIQEEDARFFKKHSVSRHANPLPLYTREDADRAAELLAPTPRDKWKTINNSFEFRFHNAGHLLGASSVELAVTENRITRTILFSGDIGRFGTPFTPDPAKPPACDFLILESTYGDRLHPQADPADGLAELIKTIWERGSVLFIPAFAVGRSQQVLFMIRQLELANRIPPIHTYLDSPMAFDATEIYCQYPHETGISVERLPGGESALDGPRVHFHRSRDESKTLNSLKGPFVLISSSGMLTGGRALHHISRLAPDSKNIILFVGYQAAGTRGRALLEGAREIRVHSRMVSVAAEVKDLEGMSGHGDRAELLRWIGGIPNTPRVTYLTHGEYDAALALREHIVTSRGWEAHIPELGETVEL